MTEREIIIYETERNKAMDAYFNARPQLLRSIEQEKLFEAGFRMAWQARARLNDSN